jgi:hypothetical protein
MRAWSTRREPGREPWQRRSGCQAGEAGSNVGEERVWHRCGDLVIGQSLYSREYWIIQWEVIRLKGERNGFYFLLRGHSPPSASRFSLSSSSPMSF